MIKAKTAEDLFNKIRSKFSNIQLGDAEGSVTADPKEAVFFDFDFSENKDSFGRVSISIADNESMKVFYNQGLVEKIDEASKSQWYSFLKELKDFAVEHQVSFDVRDITKPNLTQQDFKNLSDRHKAVNTDSMSEELSRLTKLAGIQESMKGTKKSSWESLDKTKLIIRHKNPVDETVPGARSRQINSLYIENEQGERFKYPYKHLAGARAMARHVANGGVPHDEFGKHIVKMSEQIAQLNDFARYAANKDQLNDNAGDIIEKTKLKLENIKNYVRNLSKQHHYIKTKENFKPTEMAELDDATRNGLKDKFTLKHFDKKIEDALPLINSIMKEYDDQHDELPAVPDRTGLIQSFLSNPENKLILRKDPAADKMLSVTKFTNKNTMLSTILSDIASRMLTRNDSEETITNFAATMANEIGGEGEAFQASNKDKSYAKNKALAIQLAKRYIDDYKKMKSDPAYADEIRQEPGKFEPKKNRQGKPREESAQFEAWANRTESKINEGIHSLPDEDHAGTNFSKLKDVMSKHFPVGTEGVNATATLQKLGFGDDELFDNLRKTAEDQGPDTCARPMVHDYVLNLLSSPNANKYYTPEQHTALHDAVTTSEKDFMGKDTAKQTNKSDDSFDYALSTTKAPAESVVKESNRPIMIDGKQVDLNTIEYEMQDVSDNIYDLQGARFTDGTELSDEQMEKLMVDMNFNDWVQQDYAERGADAMQEAPVDTSDMSMAGIGHGEKEEIQQILNKHKADFDKVKAGDDLMNHDDLYSELFSYYMSNGEMPYAVAKAREGSPDTWIMDRLDNMGLMEMTDEGNEFSQAVQKAKAAGMKPGDKFKVSGKEYTLKDAVEAAGLSIDDFFQEDTNI